MSWPLCRRRGGAGRQQRRAARPAACRCTSPRGPRSADARLRREMRGASGMRRRPRRRRCNVHATTACGTVEVPVVMNQVRKRHMSVSACSIQVFDLHSGGGAEGFESIFSAFLPPALASTAGCCFQRPIPSAASRGDATTLYSIMVYERCPHLESFFCIASSVHNVLNIQPQ
jgi:hypothetical protein